ncbi:hypothetical protein [Shouchella shacheensis]|uniref:hypothetical protein n=1 Tax=Shouchella shacheensis TaxID=1649580 RepID=UPI00074011AF|nr:hypothetical protein [Shouchella shacheensis]
MAEPPREQNHDFFSSLMFGSNTQEPTPLPEEESKVEEATGADEHKKEGETKETENEPETEEAAGNDQLVALFALMQSLVPVVEQFKPVVSAAGSYFKEKLSDKSSEKNSKKTGGS